MKTLGKIIEKGRIKKGLNLEEAAERTKISRMTLRRLEKNQTDNIKIENFISIANFLEIDFLKCLTVGAADVWNWNYKYIKNYVD